MSDQRNNFSGQNRGQGGYQGPQGRYDMPNQNNGYYSNQQYNSYNQQQNYSQQSEQAQANQQQQMLGGTNWDEFEIVRKKRHGKVCSTLLAIGGAITFARNLVFNIFFLFLAFLLFGGIFAVKSLMDTGLGLNSAQVEKIDATHQRAEVLFFDLKGPISEVPFAQGKLETLQRELELALYGRMSHELVAIEKALYLVAKDPGIKRVILKVDGMGDATVSMMERIAKAIEDLRKASQGRIQVDVIGMNYSQAAYILASAADHVVLDPLGEIGFKGIALSSLYFKDTLEKAKITPYVFRAGHFKSAVEPFILNGMSYDVRREYQAIAFKSWDIYKESINRRQAIRNKDILPDAETYSGWLAKFGGDRSKLQKAEGFVDEVTPLDSYLYELSKEVRADGDNPNLPAIITYQDYLMLYHFRENGEQKLSSLSQVALPNNLINQVKQQANNLVALSKTQDTSSPSISSDLAYSNSSYLDVTPLGQEANNNPNTSSNSNLEQSINNAKRSLAKSLGNAKRIEVIYGVGEISDLSEKPTDFTYDNVAPLITQAQHDRNVAGIVLYLNSPGGSVIASEKIRRAIQAYKRSNKPIVVSMNGTAASGAYWIASEADAIYATKSTITGSIGVFGVAFGVHDLLNRYGTYQDGVATNELALTPIAKEMPQSHKKILNLSVEKTYNDFINLVSQNRKIDKNDYQIYAEGQIFLAEEGKILGLVDQIGTLDDAIEATANLAKVNLNQVDVKHVAPGTNNNLGGIDNLFFGLASSYLPDELTYALIEMRKNSKIASSAEKPHIMAISPLSEPKL